MPDTTLTADTGRPAGSSAVRRLRAEGKIPGVLYGHGGPSVPLAVDRRALRLALSGPAGENALLELRVDGRRELALVKDIQRHPVRRTVLHVDFLRVDVNERVTVEVPIVLEGTAKEVLVNDGLVDPALNTLTVETTPDAIPDTISVDVTNLVIGDVVRVRDVVLPDGVTTPLDPDTPVVTAEGTRATMAAAEEAAAEVGAGPVAAAEGEAGGEGGGEEPAGEEG